jgi:hypothetical protein
LIALVDSTTLKRIFYFLSNFFDYTNIITIKFNSILVEQKILMEIATSSDDNDTACDKTLDREINAPCDAEAVPLACDEPTASDESRANDFMSLMPKHIIRDLTNRLNKLELPVDESNSASLKIIKRFYESYLKKRERARLASAKTRALRLANKLIEKPDESLVLQSKEEINEINEVKDEKEIKKQNKQVKKRDVRTPMKSSQETLNDLLDFNDRDESQMIPPLSLTPKKLIRNESVSLRPLSQSLADLLNF